MWTLGGTRFETATDRRLLFRNLTVDSLVIASGVLLGVGLGVAGYWTIPFLSTVELLAIYGLGGALYAFVSDYYLKERCKDGKAYPVDLLYAVLTPLIGLGILFLVRFPAGWVIGSLSTSTTVGVYALIYSAFSLFLIGAAGGGAATHLIFERGYSIERWYRTGTELGTRRRRTVFYMRPASRR